MRVCYLVQAHRNPRQIERLVATLGRESPGALVVVALDDHGCALDPDRLRQGAEAHLLPIRGPLRRGFLSMLDPYFAAVAWLRRRGVAYDWLVYLSGQDYPVRPLARLEAELAATDRDGFLRFWPALAADGPWRGTRRGRLRYWYRYAEGPRWSAPGLRLLRLLNGWQRLWHVQLVYGPRIGWRRLRTPFDSGRVCYAGWQWHTLRRDCAEFALDARDREPDLIAYFRRTICPDEALVQTLLVNAGSFRFENDNRRYVDFDGSRDGHPRTLGVADFDRITTGAFDLARKLDLDAEPALFDRLDRWLTAHG